MTGSGRLERAGPGLGTAALPAVLIVCISLSTSQLLRGADAKPESESVAVKVSWDFGSGPGKTSNFYVGERLMQARYDTPDCAARFALESARYEFAAGADSKQQGPPFIMFTFRKQFAGDFELLPRVRIAQSGKSKKERAVVAFPFREKRMAAPVPDWSQPNIEIQIGAPGAIMDLHNPYDWSEIEVACE